MQSGRETIRLENVSVSTTDGKHLLRNIDLRIDAGEAVVLLGRSGAGKTTLLKLINGLVRPGTGNVFRDGERITERNVVAVRRRTGYVMQSAALFPHRTVYDNVATVPRLLGWPEETTRAAAEAMLERLSLPLASFGSRFARSLSGGEQQRVAIARALVAQPPLLLCDEPFSALDPIVRREQQSILRALQQSDRRTVVFVTHDVAEATRIGERILLVDGGEVVVDASRDQFLRSSHPLVQAFIEGVRLRDE